MRQINSIFIFYLGFCSLVGCGSTLQEFGSVKGATQEVSPVQEETSPFDLELKGAKNDGQLLRVLAQVVAMTTWDPSKVVVRLSGFYQGQFVRDHKMLLAIREKDSIKPEFWGPGQKEVELVLPVEGITEYQLELLWGEEAAVYTQTLLEEEKASVLEVRELKFTREEKSCEKCLGKLAIEGKLVNEGTHPLTEATLGVALLNKSDPYLLDVFPDREEKVTISALNFMPGETTTIKLIVDREIPEGAEQGLEPKLRAIKVR